MYTLYIANKNYSSWSLRPWVLMTQLGVPFNEVLVPLEDQSSWSRYRAFSPTGLVPCLVDGERHIWESLAIVEYLHERHADVWPSDADARAWARSAAAEMHAGFSALRNQCPMTVGQRIDLHTTTAALTKDMKRLNELWTEGLSKFNGPFLAGQHFSAVDAFFCPVAFRLRTFTSATSADSLVTGIAAEYAQRLLQLPAMQAWESAALAEIWREPVHEAEISALGTIRADYRAKTSTIS